MAIRSWGDVSGLSEKRYVCGHCGAAVAPASGYHTLKTQIAAQWFIYICPFCAKPTFCDDENRKYPGRRPGKDVQHLPDDVGCLYNEARQCMTVNASTGAVLACRKILMHVGVDKGAEENKRFAYYVEYLAEKHFIPPGATGWVDHIRDKGNEANHEIRIMEQPEAEKLIKLVGFLLQTVYEMPAEAPDPNAADSN